ncbi:hypothetical protein GUITHDRAFT_142685 [Guillardia theta CCMP2712]|uniref:Uncharacterized protein n=1 Tax=Guillardia theta (strain CCMP2712) TaxID=905079 RepID=L1IWV1_GUITC|nr:hypothetical protein GUITHDRAFT_142685 [Guillardia theta CCMP2712]EKX40592.1 hypothetical protein GUITHDRAFT_142685 [Guillardia theta CCMP2712]|eukprot:XP_005827572.1 hypothetical protein GUITHDRAFT_142685 [Guillardia theta CCMP2712]
MLGLEDGARWMGWQGERARARRTHVMLGDPRKPEEQVCVRALVPDDCGRRRGFGCNGIGDVDLFPPALEEVATVGGILLVLLISGASRLLGRSSAGASSCALNHPEHKGCRRTAHKSDATGQEGTMTGRVTQAIETFKMMSFSHLLRPRKLRSFFSLFTNPEFRQGCVDVFSIFNFTSGEMVMQKSFLAIVISWATYYVFLRHYARSWFCCFSGSLSNHLALQGLDDSLL